MKKRIEEALQENLKPKFLEVINNSYKHSGHAGDNGTGETHYLVKIKSQEFKNLTLVAAHRRVNSILKDEFTKGLHALEIKIIN